MAKVWPVYEGRHPTSGAPWADVPVSTAARLLELTQRDFVASFSVTPRFGDTERDLRWAGYKQVVVEVEPHEAAADQWKVGFYKSRIKPKEALRRLIENMLTTVLGENNVIRVEYDDTVTVDSYGQNALGVLVVLSPDAVTHMVGESVIQAPATLKEQLRRMWDFDIPLIIQYATEAELAEDAGA